jgi:hypothetical protein
MFPIRAHWADKGETKLKENAHNNFSIAEYYLVEK